MRKAALIACLLITPAFQGFGQEVEKRPMTVDDALDMVRVGDALISPDGEWVLFQVCDPAADPGHDWSDIWIGRPDGSENRALTQGEAAWFAASYGPPDNPGGGSLFMVELWKKGPSVSA